MGGLCRQVFVISRLRHDRTDRLDQCANIRRAVEQGGRDADAGTADRPIAMHRENPMFVQQAFGDRHIVLHARPPRQTEGRDAAVQARIGLSQSALSQHLALLREQGVVATRREGQTIYYRIADHAALRVIQTLAELFCPPEMRK